MRRILLFLSSLCLLFLLSPAAALADVIDPRTQGQWPLTTVQLTTLFVGALVPIATYLLNHFGPQQDEKTKAFVLVIVSAIAGGLWQAIEVGGVGFNDQTLQFVASAIGAALLAHNWFWKPSTISTHLGAGTNAQRK